MDFLDEIHQDQLAHGSSVTYTRAYLQSLPVARRKFALQKLINHILNELTSSILRVAEQGKTSYTLYIDHPNLRPALLNNEALKEDGMLTIFLEELYASIKRTFPDSRVRIEGSSDEIQVDWA
jgi:hypothetical protein